MHSASRPEGASSLILESQEDAAGAMKSRGILSVIDEATTRIAEAARVTVVSAKAASGQSLERRRAGFGAPGRGGPRALLAGPPTSESTWSGSIAIESPRERVVRPLLRFFPGSRDTTSTNLFVLAESVGQPRVSTLMRNPSDALKAAISLKMSP
jgi:hypothetical protein